MEPSIEPGEVRHRQALTTEMADALGAGLSPPLGGLLDVRGAVRRSAVGATLTAEELAEVAGSLRVIGEADRWLGRVGEQFPRLGSIRQEVGEFSGVVNAIDGCLDARGRVLDTASRRLSEIRREIAAVEERIQDRLRSMLRSPEVRRFLRYPNFTVVGQHYVLPVAREYRGEIQGAVHRTSASNETVYIEPQAVAEQSAQLSYLRARESKEIRRILRWLSAQVGQVAGPVVQSLDALAGLDLVLARGRYSVDYRMTPPDLNGEGKVLLRGARHPILEHLFREENKRLRAEAEAALAAGDDPAFARVVEERPAAAPAAGARPLEAPGLPPDARRPDSGPAAARPVDLRAVDVPAARRQPLGAEGAGTRAGTGARRTGGTVAEGRPRRAARRAAEA